MKRKKIQYNEINEEIYVPKFWTKTKLVFLAIFILTAGFLLNFSLESRLSAIVKKALLSNPNCPVQIERLEVKYFLPKITLKSPVIMGQCFGQYNNRLELNDLSLSFNSPSFYPVGLRFHLETSTQNSRINAYPVISLLSQNIKIEKTLIDSEIIGPFMANGISPLSGSFSVEGFFEFKSGKISSGEFDVLSKNFYVPAQNLSGFELTRLNLNTFKLSGHFQSPELLVIDGLQLGEEKAPLSVSLNGQLQINENQFNNSRLVLEGNLNLSKEILTNFAFLNLFLPASNTSGNYQIKLDGPLANLGAPQIK